ncbi:MAG TPA: fumarylacetoacetate hydrolase family protein [Xanthobacteraceae bacterium]|nr:fumarylacetoacetate hydrolase family protein [Xanthobacteraceae bacterium]
MNGTAFKLATLAKPDGDIFVAIVLGDEAIDLKVAQAAFRAAGRKGELSASDSVQGLLEQWDRNFAALQEVAAFLEKEGARQDAANFGTAKLTDLKALPPVLRPGKMFYAAQNFQEHVNEMIRAGMSPTGGPVFTGEKSTTAPYLFLKAPSCLAGAFDDIAIPRGMKKIDWEAEIALAIGRPGKRIKAEHALAHVAGFMTTNDVSCRDLQIRADRPALRSDWLGGKSHDNFAPMGPYLVPRAFVPDHMNLFIKLTVNGEVKQDGNTSQFIFTPEEQIEYASNILSLETGDIFSCGTCGGVGQGTNTFLKAGDIVETEIELLGRMRNRFVAEA